MSKIVITQSVSDFLRSLFLPKFFFELLFKNLIFFSKFKIILNYLKFF